MDDTIAPHRSHRLSRRHLFGAAGLTALVAPVLELESAHAERAHQTASTPIQVTIQSPGDGDQTGINGAFTIVDLQLDATAGHNDLLVGQPRFIAPTDPAFGPGPNPAVPGLVVLFSTTKAFHGPQTNLANLFQLTGVGSVDGNKEVWTTWLVGKPIAGVNVDSTLTTFVMSGTAPTVVPTDLSTLPIISNIAKVTFHISGTPGVELSATPYHPSRHHRHHHGTSHHGKQP